MSTKKQQRKYDVFDVIDLLSHMQGTLSERVELKPVPTSNANQLLLACNEGDYKTFFLVTRIGGTCSTVKGFEQLVEHAKRYLASQHKSSGKPETQTRPVSR